MDNQILQILLQKNASLIPFLISIPASSAITQIISPFFCVFIIHLFFLFLSLILTILYIATRVTSLQNEANCISLLLENLAEPSELSVI